MTAQEKLLKLLKIPQTPDNLERLDDLLRLRPWEGYPSRLFDFIEKDFGIEIPNEKRHRALNKLTITEYKELAKWHY